MADKIENDPVVNRFLEFLAEDMIRNPGILASCPESLIAKFTEIAGCFEDVDVHEPIEGEVAI